MDRHQAVAQPVVEVLAVKIPEAVVAEWVFLFIKAVQAAQASSSSVTQFKEFM